MGAGASIGGIPKEKMDNYIDRLCKLKSLNENQKERLLQQLSHEAIKATGGSSQSDEDKAAAKMQTLARGRQRRAEQASGCSGGSLPDVFQKFCQVYRQEMMTNTVWAKFCKDGKLLDSKFKKQDIDMVWTKAAGKAKKVPFEVFLKLLAGVAEKKGITADEVNEFVLSNSKGPSSSGTVGKSRFYDDKTTWTGTATEGGPSTNDNVPTLETMTNNKK